MCPYILLEEISKSSGGMCLLVNVNGSAPVSIKFEEKC